MSTATTVPETYELEGDDALRTLRATGPARLARDAFLRLRAADGFSHARSLAYAIAIAVLPLLIAFVGFATLLDQERFTQAVQRGVEGVAPGPAGRVVTQAFEQGERSGRSGSTAALVTGLAAALIGATVAMAQVERGANRIYGQQADRPTLQRYTQATRLACTAGLLLTAAIVLLLTGATAGRALGLEEEVATVWGLLRWPLGIAAAVVGFALLFQRAPRRRQPAASWLAFGSAIAFALWLALTGLLALYLTGVRSFGQTYGPLAGVIGLLLWALATSVALFYGLACAAQLEAVRSGVVAPRADQGEPVGRSQRI
jgi:YihY family inner membrane protein